MNSQARALTPSEERAIGLIKLFDKAADERKNIITLFGGKEAAQVITALDVKGRIKAKVEWDTRQSKYAITFRLPEFYKYLLFILSQTGLSLQTDGSLRTYDNLTISNEYTQ